MDFEESDHASYRARLKNQSQTAEKPQEFLSHVKN